MTYCYVFARTDLDSLGHGKALAHAHHAGSHLTWTLAVEPLRAGLEIPEDVLAWHLEGGGFGTTLAIGGRDEMDLDTMTAITGAAARLGHRSGLVVDPTYPYLVSDEIMHLIDRSIHTAEPVRNRKGWTCFRRETTCGWILGAKPELQIILSRFGLTPNHPLAD